MAIELASAYVSLVPSFKGGAAKLQREFGQPLVAEGAAAGDRASKGFLGRFGAGLKGIAGVAAGAFAGIKVAGFIGDTISAASDLSETTSKVQVVFGDAAKDVFDFGKTSATALGQSKGEALAAAGTFGNLLRAVGLGEQESAKFSTSMVTLASDLASFNNTSSTDALDALRAGLVGETEPLKRFGVNLNEATLKAKALELGLADGKKPLDANAKAQAAYALIMEQTTLAQGDFARTSDGLANKQKILGARFEDIKATLGQRLLPIATRVTSFFADNLPRAFDTVSRALAPIVDGFQRFWAAISTGFTEGEGGTWFESLALTLRNDVLPVIREVVDWIGDNLATVFKVAVGAVIAFGGPITALVVGFVALYTQSQAFRDIIGNIVGFITDTVVPGIEKLVAVFKEDGLSGALAFIGTAITNFLPVLGEKVGQLAATFIRWVTDSVPPLLRELGKWIGALLTWLVETGIPKAVEGLVKMAAEFVKWVAPAIPPLLLELGKLLLGITAWVLTDALPKLVTELAKWGLEFIKWVGPAALDLIVELGKLYVRMQTWIITDALPKIVTALLRWAGAFIGWVADAVRDLPAKLGGLLVDILEWAAKVPGKIMEKLGDLAGQIARAFLNWGADAADAFVRGLGNLPARILNKIPDAIPGGRSPHLGVGGHGPARNARGTPFFRGGWTWAGEEGPELLRLPRGTEIFSHQASMAMLADVGQRRAGITIGQVVVDESVDLWEQLRRTELLADLAAHG